MVASYMSFDKKKVNFKNINYLAIQLLSISVDVS